MTANPKTIEPNALAARALADMERSSITSLFVLDPGSRHSRSASSTCTTS